MKDKTSDKLTRETLRFYYRAALRHPAELWLAFLLPIGAMLTGVAVPFFASKVFAGLARQNPALYSNLAWLAAACALGIILNRIGFAKFMVLQARTMADLNAAVFERLLRRSIGYHVDNISGKLISDSLEFVSGFSSLISAIFSSGLSFCLVVVAGIIIVFINSWQLGAYLLVTVVLTIGWAYTESRKRSALRHNRLIATKKLTAHLSDSIVNAQTIKTFAGETQEIRQNRNLNNILRDLRVRDWQRAGVSGSNRMTALLAMQFGMILLLINLSRHDPAVLATGIFAFTYTFNLTNRLFELNNLTRQIEEAFLEAAPTTKMLLETVEINDKPNARRLVISQGAIDIRSISFAYQDETNNQPVFADFSLEIAPGEKVGLVGPSGGGKSTLTRLLLRFDEVQSGHILVDGQDVTDVTQASLRQAVSYVPQEPLLFHRSIKANIAYGKPDATDNEIIAAAKKANAHAFIKALPKGYDTVVGERGVKLSGGQRQRVAIARAILKDAPILVLDEATSALDSENEHEVQRALWALMKGRTVIVVAHRLSTIQKMDRIIVIVDGRITEAGPHRELLDHDRTYARLWAHQSGGFIEA